MPNYCYFDMVVTGRKDNVNEFIRIMQNDYTKTHMFRIFEAEVYEREDVGLMSQVKLFGNCAWSVASCMLDGPITYYNDYIDAIRRHPERYVGFGPGTHLRELSQKLKLAIEVYSEECGMCFCEWYYFKNGEFLEDQVGNYEEFPLSEYEDYQQFVADWRSWRSDNSRNDELPPVTEEQFNQSKEYGEDWFNYSEFNFDEKCHPDLLNTCIQEQKKEAPMYHLVAEGEQYVPLKDRERARWSQSSR